MTHKYGFGCENGIFLAVVAGGRSFINVLRGLVFEMLQGVPLQLPVPVVRELEVWHVRYPPSPHAKAGRGAEKGQGNHAEDIQRERQANLQEDRQGHQQLARSHVRLCKHQFTRAFYQVWSLTQLYSAHWSKKKFRRIKIAFGLCSSRNTMKIDGALFWHLRNFFGDFTHLNCPSLCCNLMIIITDTFFHFSLNKLQPFVVVVTCFENLKRNKVATKVKTFQYRQQFFCRKFSSGNQLTLQWYQFG